MSKNIEIILKDNSSYTFDKNEKVAISCISKFWSILLLVFGILLLLLGIFYLATTGKLKAASFGIAILLIASGISLIRVAPSKKTDEIIKHGIVKTKCRVRAQEVAKHCFGGFSLFLLDNNGKKIGKIASVMETSDVNYV